MNINRYIKFQSEHTEKEMQTDEIINMGKNALSFQITAKTKEKQPLDANKLQLQHSLAVHDEAVGTVTIGKTEDVKRKT